MQAWAQEENGQPREAALMQAWAQEENGQPREAALMQAWAQEENGQPREAAFMQAWAQEENFAFFIFSTGKSINGEFVHKPNWGLANITL